MSDMIYRLVLKARFEDAAQLEGAIQGLERLQIQGANVSIRMGAMGREGAAGLDSIARSALRVGFMFNMLESAYMRATMATIILDNAQDRYNKTVEKYGEHSEEAQKAAKQLEMRMDYLNLANTRANVSMGIMLLQLALQSNLLDKATLSTIAHTVATGAATIKEWLHNAALSAKAILLAMINPYTAALGIAAATGVGAYIGSEIMAARTVNTPPSQITVEGSTINVTEDVEAALEKDKEEKMQEYERLR